MYFEYWSERSPKKGGCMKMYMILCALIGCSISSMEQDLKRELSRIVYTIPGQNGLGSEEEYVEEVLGDDITIVPVNTPSYFPDLGQSFCQRHVTQALKKNNYQEGIIYATSQGTATALNYVASHQHHPIKALVLEAALASGNSAVHHTLTGELADMPWVKKIPASYYTLPYLASLVCWGYRPAGQQPIKSVDTISTDLPIIIVHSKDDPQLSFDGACALYYRLRMNGNDNAYFIQKKGCKHTQLFNFDKSYIVSRILNYHLDKQSRIDTADDFKKFQPQPSQFKKQYDALIAQEKKHAYLEHALVAGLLMSGAALAGSLAGS
jgi:hypothetical protein